MSYHVRVVLDAEHDLFSIYRAAAEQSPAEAKQLIDRLGQLCASLDEMPERGTCPPELERIGVRDYLEIRHKEYRIIYHILPPDVYILCVLDSKKDIQEQLLRRLLDIGWGTF